MFLIFADGSVSCFRIVLFYMSVAQLVFYLNVGGVDVLLVYIDFKTSMLGFDL